MVTKSQLLPYIRLTRIDKPIGIFLILWPCWWSIMLASSGGEFPWVTFVLFGVGAVLMRSSGCIVNDIIDRKIDAEVERTKNRPLASGELKVANAICLLLVLLGLSYAILLSFDRLVILLGYLALVPVFLYPMMKRVTYWPQLFLGFTFNSGVLMAWVAVKGQLSVEAFILYFGAVFWTLGFDTIYAHQDRKYDHSLGLKSTALKLGTRTQRYVCIFYFLSVAFIWGSSAMVDLNMWFHVFLVIASMQFLWQVMTLDIDSSEDCMHKFLSNRYFGAIIFAGLALGVSDKVSYF